MSTVFHIEILFGQIPVSAPDLPFTRVPAPLSGALTNQFGNKIDSLDISKDIYDKVVKYKLRGLPVEVLAEVVKGKNKGKYYNLLKILKVRRGDLPLRQIRDSRAEQKMVADFLAGTQA